MKIRYLIIFAAGVVVGSVLLLPVMADLLPTWKADSVKPVIMVKYDNFDTFKPVEGSSLFPPSWKLSEVTPMTVVQYQSMGDNFVPLYSDSQYVPAWKKESVTPWAEVTLDAFGNFRPKYSQ